MIKFPLDMGASPLNICSRCLVRSTRSQFLRSTLGTFRSYHLQRRLPDPVHERLPQKFRRSLQTQEFKPFVPPSPESLPRAAPPKHYRRTRKWARRLLYLAIGLGVAYEIDQYFLYASLTRSMRTFWLGVVVATDYKINFRPNPPLADSIQALHNRNAERLFDLLRTNGGLYLKIGQAIAMQVFRARAGAL